MYRVYLDSNTGNISIDGIDTHPYLPNDLIAIEENGLISIDSQNNNSRVLDKKPYTYFNDRNGDVLSSNLSGTIDELNSIFTSTISMGGLSLIEVNAAIATYLIANPVSSNNIFPVWAEENSSLGTNAIEWAFGNGANCPNNQGVVLPVDCELFAGGLSLAAGSATVGIYKNGVKVSDIVSGTTVQRTLNTLVTTISFSAGDVVGFQTTLAAGTSSPNIVTAWFRGV